MDKQGFKGAVVFYKDPNIDADLIFTAALDGFWRTVEEWREERAKRGIIYLGHAEVDVSFVDSTAAEIAALEKQIEKERAESWQRVQRLTGRIKDLQALTYQKA